MGKFIYGLICIIIGIALLVYGAEATQLFASFGGGLLLGYGAVMAVLGLRDL